MDELRRMSVQVQEALRRIPGASDVRDNMGPSRLDVKLLPNREALDFYEIDQDDLAYQVRFAMTDDEIGKFPLGGTETIWRFVSVWHGPAARVCRAVQHG